MKFDSRGFSSTLTALTIAISGTIVLCANVGTAWAIKPWKKYSRTPSSLGISYDSLNIPTANSERLTAWLCHPARKQSDQVIILAESDAGNMSDELDMAQALVKNLGIEVLLFDYRGFGTSDSIAIDTDFIALPAFAYDLHSVVTYVRKKLQPDSSKIVLYGVSMGAGLAMTVASEFHGVGAVIAESPYVSQLEIKNYYDSVYTAESSTRRIKTIRSILLEPLETIHNLTCPILIMHGELEKQISTRGICELFMKCPSRNKTLWIVGNAGHMQIPFKQTGAFLNVVYSFLKSADTH